MAANSKTSRRLACRLGSPLGSFRQDPGSSADEAMDATQPPAQSGPTPPPTPGPTPAPSPASTGANKSGQSMGTAVRHLAPRIQSPPAGGSGDDDKRTDQFGRGALNKRAAAMRAIMSGAAGGRRHGIRPATAAPVGRAEPRKPGPIERWNLEARASGMFVDNKGKSGDDMEDTEEEEEDNGEDENCEEDDSEEEKEKINVRVIRKDGRPSAVVVESEKTIVTLDLE